MRPHFIAESRYIHVYCNGTCSGKKYKWVYGEMPIEGLKFKYMYKGSRRKNRIGSE